jgi:hypothetical protein
LTVDTGERAVSFLSFDVKLTTSLQEEKIWIQVVHAIDKFKVLGYFLWRDASQEDK